MNAFVEHHQLNIKFRYRCFDRLLLNGCIQSFLQGARAQNFFWVYRKIYPVRRNALWEVARAIITTGLSTVLRSGTWKS